MANRIPFTVYAKIIPQSGNGKRFELVRSREKIAWQVRQDLLDNFTDGNLADGGGSGTFAIDIGDGWSFLVKTVAVKPAFGEFPDAVMIEGFYNGTAQAHPQLQLIHAGSFVTGPLGGSPGWRADLGPSTGLLAQVSALKSALEAAITSVSVEIIKIDCAGVQFGHGGHHFPS